MAATLRGLEGKVVLITGAGRGQGANHARAFAEAGCDVALLDICRDIPNLYSTATEAELHEVAAQVRERGAKALELVCDVRDEAAVQDAVARTLADYGRIDVLVNNAGMAALDTIHDMRSDVLHAVIDTNLKGPMLLAKYVVPDMIGRRSGTIINIASAVVGSGHAMLSHYVASKHGVVGLTRSWATELSEFDINVNCILPATIKPGRGMEGTGMVLGLSEFMQMDPDEAYETFSSQGNLPGDKWRATMEDITDAVLFLASDNAAKITGISLPVDCGQTTK